MTDALLLLQQGRNLARLEASSGLSTCTQTGSQVSVGVAKTWAAEWTTCKEESRELTIWHDRVTSTEQSRSFMLAEQ